MDKDTNVWEVYRSMKRKRFLDVIYSNLKDPDSQKLEDFLIMALTTYGRVMKHLVTKLGAENEASFREDLGEEYWEIHKVITHILFEYFCVGRNNEETEE